MGSFVSDLLLAGFMQSQAQMLKNMQRGLDRSKDILSNYIEADKEKSPYVAKQEEKQLKGLDAQGGTLNQYLTDTMAEQQKMLDKASKETDDTNKDTKNDKKKKNPANSKDENNINNIPAAVTVDISVSAALKFDNTLNGKEQDSTSPAMVTNGDTVNNSAADTNTLAAVTGTDAVNSATAQTASASQPGSSSAIDIAI